MPGFVFLSPQLRAVHPNGPNLGGTVLVYRPSAGMFVRDIYDGGPGEIRGGGMGLTTFDGVPGRARVYVLDRITPRVIRATRSNADGTYRLTHLALNRDYTVLGIDENDQDNAVVMDRIRALVPES